MSSKKVFSMASVWIFSWGNIINVKFEIESRIAVSIFGSLWFPSRFEQTVLKCGISGGHYGSRPRSKLFSRAPPCETFPRHRDRGREILLIFLEWTNTGRSFAIAVNPLAVLTRNFHTVEIVQPSDSDIFPLKSLPF